MTTTAARFITLSNALTDSNAWYQKNAAVAWRTMLPALALTGSPDEIITRLLDFQAKLGAHAPWYSMLSMHPRIGLAAMCLSGDALSATRLAAELDRVRGLFGEVGLKRDHYHVGVMLGLAHILQRTQPLDRHDAQDLKSLYDAVSSAQWWLTNAQDLPALMLLHSTDRAPEVLAAEHAAMYQALHSEGRRLGNSLQSASFTLVALGCSPELVVGRVNALAKGFTATGLRILRQDEDELALLAAREDPVDELVQRVLEQREALKPLGWSLGRQAAFELAVSLTCIELGSTTAMGRAALAAKALGDVYEILSAQLAAAAAGGVAAI